MTKRMKRVFGPAIKAYSFFHRSINDPAAYLSGISPDRGMSCIRSNTVSINPEFDLLVIVPVYKVEKYLRACLDSIVGQKTRFSFKVVAVNDGSPDASREILKEYESLWNVTVIDQENNGLSGARNAALKEIDARYVTFVDSDDLLCDGALEALLSAADESGADIVQGNYSVFDDNGESPCRLSKGGNVNSSELPGYVWGKIYKAEVFESICMPEGYWFEDTLNALVLFNLNPDAFVIPQCIYKYRFNAQGITASSGLHPRTLDTVWVTLRLWEDMKDMGLGTSAKAVNSLKVQMKYNVGRLVGMNDLNVLYVSLRRSTS